MGIYVPSAGEIADFLESGTCKKITESTNAITHFSDDITLKIIRGNHRRFYAKREEKNACLFRAYGMNVPRMYDVVQLRKLEKGSIPKKLKNAGTKPWVVVMEHIHGKLLSKLSKKEAEKLEPDFEDMLKKLETLPLCNNDDWELTELILSCKRKIYLLDLESCEPGPVNGLNDCINIMRNEYYRRFKREKKI